MERTEDSLDFANAFGKVNNATRLSIVEELALVRAESPRDPVVSFSELRERVGEPDSGTFNYHLDQLRGLFVQKTDDGYVLTPEGRRFAAIVAAGGMSGQPPGYPHQLDSTCPVCDGDLTLDYRDGVFGAECSNDHQFRNTVPRTVVDGRSISEAVAIFTKYIWTQLSFARDGRCPECFGDLDCHVFELDDTYDVRIGFEGVCHQCGDLVHVPVGLVFAQHPRVLALRLPHDPGYMDRPIWELEAVTDRIASVVDRDPLVVDLTYESGTESVILSVDESATVSIRSQPS